MSLIEINSIKMHYEVEGEGIPLVLIHGFCDNLNFWKVLDKTFLENFKLIKIDLRGHGQSEFGREPFSIELLSKDIMLLLEKLAIKKFYLMGFSLGGTVAIDIAKNLGENVEKLVLLSTFAQYDENIRNCFDNMFESLDSSYEEFFDTIINYTLPECEIKKREKDFEKIKEKKKNKVNVDDLVKILPVGLYYDGNENIDKITAKTLIISSKEDEIVKTSVSKDLNNKIANSKFIEIDNVKHNLCVGEEKSLVNKLILDFLLDE